MVRCPEGRGNAYEFTRHTPIWTFEAVCGLAYRRRDGTPPYRLAARGARVLLVSRIGRQAGDVSRHFHPVHRPGRPDRAVLDGPHPAGTDRPQAESSTVRGHSHALPPIARLWRAALAVGLDLGVLERPER